MSEDRKDLLPNCGSHWTKCWRSGCTKFMQNGYDHPGLCTVVMESTRRSEPEKSDFALIDSLPADLLSYLATSLPAQYVLLLEMCSKRLVGLLREDASIWRAMLQKLLGGTIQGLQDHATVDHRSLFRTFHMPLEVKGWASTDECEAGDMNAWWRCRAVGLIIPPSTPSACGCVHARGKRRKRSESASTPTCPMVRVRYEGYKPSDDEWRNACSLRRSPGLTGMRWDTWKAAQRRVGDRIECSAPPCPGHPPALWEATLCQRVRRMGRPQRPWDAAHPNRDVQLLVHFDGFDDELDEWICADSKRVRPPGGGGGGVCADIQFASMRTAELAAGSALAGPSSSAGASVAAAPFTTGQQVDGRYFAKDHGSFAASWYPAKIVACHPGISGPILYDLQYDDGDYEEGVPPKFLRVRRGNGGGAGGSPGGKARAVRASTQQVEPAAAKQAAAERKVAQRASSKQAGKAPMAEARAPVECRDDDPGEYGFFQAERLVGRKVSEGLAVDGYKKNLLLYLVRWLGYSPEYDSWEPAANVTTELIAHYNATVSER